MTLFFRSRISNVRAGVGVLFCQALHCSLTSLETLNEHFGQAPYTFSYVVTFLGAVKESNLSSIGWEFYIKRDDTDICATTFLCAVKSNFILSELSFECLTDGPFPIFSAGRRYMCSESVNKENGITVLAAAADNVNCFFCTYGETPLFALICDRRLCVRDDAQRCRRLRS